MNGREIILMLAHLFRKYGEEIEIGKAVHILSFQWRYGIPSDIRKILTIANDNDMIKVQNGNIQAAFLFDSQALHPNQADIIREQSIVSEDVNPLY